MQVRTNREPPAGSRFVASDPGVTKEGSLIGRVILVDTTLLTALIGLVTLFGLHAGLGRLHHSFGFFHRLTENRPVMLVYDGSVIEQNLRKAHTSQLELQERLRLAGVVDVADVAVAVLERNGELSLIREGTAIDAAMFDDVIGRHHLDQLTEDCRQQTRRAQP